MTSARYVRDALIVGAAVSVFGIAFGGLATTNGLTVAQTIVMSLLAFTGASQFAAVSVVGAGGSDAAALGSALLLAARNGFYGVALARHIRAGLLRRLGAAQLVIDESTALALARPPGPDRERAFWAGGLSVFAFWNLGTALGAVGGTAIGDPETFGLDAAFPAGFVALVAPTLRRRPGLAAAVAGVVIAVVTTPLVEPGVPILLAGFGALLALAVPDGPTANEANDPAPDEVTP